MYKKITFFFTTLFFLYSYFIHAELGKKVMLTGTGLDKIPTEKKAKADKTPLQEAQNGQTDTIEEERKKRQQEKEMAEEQKYQDEKDTYLKQYMTAAPTPSPLPTPTSPAANNLAMPSGLKAQKLPLNNPAAKVLPAQNHPSLHPTP